MNVQSAKSDLEQVFEELTKHRDEVASDKGEAIVMGGMKNQAIRYDDEDGDGMSFELVDGHFYLILEIPIGEKFPITDNGGLNGFYTMGKGGIKR